MLKRLSEREDVETVRLRFNYRCGARIVEASQYALGEDRDYQAPDDAHEGTIFFHSRAGQYDQHANYLFETLLPRALERMPDVMLGDVAILYPAAWIGDPVFNAAQRYGIGVIRTDGNALYPRSSRLMRWFELCAIWCCNGWRSGIPRFSKLLGEGFRIFAEYLTSDDLKIAFQRDLMGTLWSRRNSTYNLNEWLGALYVNMISDLISRCRTLDDERVILTNFMGKTAEGGELSEMTLGQFSGHGEGNDRVNLSTLHSSKGREFKIVFLFGMDNGRLPRNNPTERELREARRLFYVGFTRAKCELHIIFTANRQSPFVEEVQQRLDVGL